MADHTSHSGDPAHRLESPARLAELRLVETLRRIGMREDSVVADIGTGSGIFALAAASLTRGTVYALDIRADMLEIVARKTGQAGAGNVQGVLVTEQGFGLPPGTVDIALMCTVLHEIADKTCFLADAAALLKPSGRLAVIEFHKRETPMGPPIPRRLGQPELMEAASAVHLSLAEAFDLGDNFYCTVFTK